MEHEGHEPVHTIHTPTKNTNATHPKKQNLGHPHAATNHWYHDKL